MCHVMSLLNDSVSAVVMSGVIPLCWDIFGIDRREHGHGAGEGERLGRESRVGERNLTTLDPYISRIEHCRTLNKGEK